MSDLDAIRERHSMKRTWDATGPKSEPGKYVTWCKGCGQRPWPCDTAQVLAHAVELEAGLAFLLVGIENNGIPHSNHSDACHEADAKLVRALLARPDSKT